MCVPKSKSTLRLESFARTDDATKLILFTVTKSLLQTLLLEFPKLCIDAESLEPRNCCEKVEVVVKFDVAANEFGPPANAYDGVGEGIDLVKEKEKYVLLQFSIILYNDFGWDLSLRVVFNHLTQQFQRIVVLCRSPLPP